MRTPAPAGPSPWDLALAAAAVSARTPALTVAFWLLTVVGDTWVMASLVLLAGLAFALFGRPKAAALFVATTAAGQLLVEVIKASTQRVRPPGAIALIATPDSYSFPSGHALTGLVFWLLGAVFVSARLRRPAARAVTIAAGAVVGLSTGASRVYLGVHWPSDILASWALASVVLTAALVTGARFGALDEPTARRIPPGWVPAVAAALALAAIALVALGALADPLVGPIP